MFKLKDQNDRFSKKKKPEHQEKRQPSFEMGYKSKQRILQRQKKKKQKNTFLKCSIFLT